MHVINLASIFRLVYNRPALHNKASVSFSFTFFSPVDTIVQMTTIFSTLIRQLMSPADTPSVPLSQPLQLTYITSYDSPPSKLQKYETATKKDWGTVGSEVQIIPYFVKICL